MYVLHIMHVRACYCKQKPNNNTKPIQKKPTTKPRKKRLVYETGSFKNICLNFN